MDSMEKYKSEFVINNLEDDQREYLLKKDVRMEISKFAGVHIAVRGRYVKPKCDGSLICENNMRPLHLLITGRSKHNLTLAMKKIQDLLHALNSNKPTENDKEELVFPEEKITVGIDAWPPAFGMKMKILGENYENINYIKKETNAIISLCGKGLHIDEDEPLHVLVQYGDPLSKQKARQLVLNLIETVQKEFLERFPKFYPPPKEPEVISVRHVRKPFRRNLLSENDASYSNTKSVSNRPILKKSSPPRRTPSKKTPPKRILSSRRSSPLRRVSPLNSVSPVRRTSATKRISPLKRSPPSRRTPTPPKAEERHNFPDKKNIDKITIGLDSVPAAFNLKSKIYGPALTNVKHIEKTTSALLLLQGRGCGGSDRFESDVPPYLLVKYQKPELRDVARNLIFNLIEAVQQEYIALYGTHVMLQKPQIVPFDASLIEKKTNQSKTPPSVKPNFTKPLVTSVERPTVATASANSVGYTATNKMSSYSKQLPEENTTFRSGGSSSFAKRLPGSKSSSIPSNSVIVPPPPPMISKPLPPVIPKPLPCTFEDEVLASSTKINQSSDFGISSNASFPTQKLQPVTTISSSQTRNLQYPKKRSQSPELPVESAYPDSKKFCNPPYSTASNSSVVNSLPVLCEQSTPKQKQVTTTRCLVPLTPHIKPIQSMTSTTATETTAAFKNGKKYLTSSQSEQKMPEKLHAKMKVETLKNGPQSDFFSYYDSAISDNDDNKSVICIDSEEELDERCIIPGLNSKMSQRHSVAVQTDDNSEIKIKKINCICGKFTHFVTGVRSLGTQTDVYGRL